MRMSATPETAAPQISVAQAIDLCLLVDQEARWENLRKVRDQPSGAKSLSNEELHAVQNAFAAFRTRLVAYNKKYSPAHATDLLLNYPERLGPWCRRMLALYLQVADDPRVPCPVHLLEKAYRFADGMAGRVGKEPFKRSAPIKTIQAAVRELEALAQWCENDARLAA
jgi:hypothetical protein